MTCEQCRDKFTELHDGAIVGEQADAVRAHIATCRQCEGEYAAFTRTITEVRALTPTAPPADLLDRIGAALDAAEPHPTPVRRTWGWTPALAAAACVMVLFVGIFALQTVGPTRAPDVELTATAPPSEERAQGPAAGSAPEASVAPTGDTSAQPDAAKAEAEPTGTAPDSVSATTAESTLGMRRPSATSSRGRRAPPAPAEALMTPDVAPSDESAREPLPRSDGNGAREHAVQPPPAPSPLAPGGVLPGPDSTMPGGSAPRSAARGGADHEGTPLPPSVPSAMSFSAEVADTGVAQPMAKSAHSEVLPLPDTGKLYVRFVPPVLRQVDKPVTSSIWVSADTDLPGAAVRVETRSDLTVLHTESGYVYRGPLVADQPREIEFKLLAQKPGTQRLRISVETPVRGLEAQMEAILPGFTPTDDGPRPNPLGKPVTLQLRETPLRDALLQIARDGGIPIIVDTNVGGERVSYSCVDTPAGSVLRILADAYGYRVEYTEGAYHVSSRR